MPPSFRNAGFLSVIPAKAGIQGRSGLHSLGLTISARIQLPFAGDLQTSRNYSCLRKAHLRADVPRPRVVAVYSEYDTPFSQLTRNLYQVLHDRLPDPRLMVRVGHRNAEDRPGGLQTLVESVSYRYLSAVSRYQDKKADEVGIIGTLRELPRLGIRPRRIRRNEGAQFCAPSFLPQVLCQWQRSTPLRCEGYGDGLNLVAAQRHGDRVARDRKLRFQIPHEISDPGRLHRAR